MIPEPVLQLLRSLAAQETGRLEREEGTPMKDQSPPSTGKLIRAPYTRMRSDHLCETLKDDRHVNESEARISESSPTMLLRLLRNFYVGVLNNTDHYPLAVQSAARTMQRLDAALTAREPLPEQWAPPKRPAHISSPATRSPTSS